MRKTLAIALLAAACAAHAETPDPSLDARVMHISEQLRCLVCQNQSIAESQADLAQDLRREVRELLASGKNEEQVRTYMVERYGDFVLYDPPFRTSTLLLWLGPALLAAAALGGFFLRLRRRRALAAPAHSAQDLARARALLADESEKS